MDVYRAEFECAFDWNDPEQQEAAIAEAAATLRAMADQLEERRADDILFRDGERQGLQGWWSGFA